MAEVGIAKPCPYCRTLLSFAGSLNDKELTVTCAVCGHTTTITNPKYYAQALNSSLKAKLAEEQTEKENASLRVQIAEAERKKSG